MYVTTLEFKNILPASILKKQQYSPTPYEMFKFYIEWKKKNSQKNRNNSESTKPRPPDPNPRPSP